MPKKKKETYPEDTNQPQGDREQDHIVKENVIDSIIEGKIDDNRELITDIVKTLKLLNERFEDIENRLLKVSDRLGFSENL